MEANASAACVRVGPPLAHWRKRPAISRGALLAIRSCHDAGACGESVRAHPRDSREMSRTLRLGIKRLMDLFCALFLGVVLSPVIALVAVAVRLSSGSPILFRQERPGRDGHIFTLLKFRTMRDARDHSGRPLSDGERLTGVGRFLRRTSLDELPEFANIIRGQMSFVCPRPLLVEYLPLYSLEQARRHEARPGLTGLAQVSGRNALTWEEKFATDVWYVDNWSLQLDLWILWRTLSMVVTGQGVTSDGHATTERFRGNQS